MDNCGFHRGRFTEDALQRILGNRGMELVFQLPYSPDFNSCEFCFRAMKSYLRMYEQFPINYNELGAIYHTLNVTQVFLTLRVCCMMFTINR